MPKLLPSLNKLRRKFIALPSLELHTSGWFSVVIVVVVASLLVINLWSVAVNAKESFDVYLFELESLAQLEDINQDLLSQKDYYESYEYQRLYARDNLRLAEGGETLYQIIEPVQYYEIDQEAVDLLSEGEFFPLWLELL